jgi:Flp pilus assembly pilin Flp
MIDRVKKMWSDEEGLTTVEYALLLALLVVAALGTWTAFGGIVRAKVDSSASSINGIS